MRLTIQIERTKRDTKTSYTETIPFDTAWLGAEEGSASVATVLRYLNTHDGLQDTEGNDIAEIAWECNCLQKKCGSCAMVINGKPQLACAARLQKLKGKTITLGPLKKFPVVKDLIVDRSILHENLRRMGSFPEADTKNLLADDDKRNAVYESSRCLLCGCCVEVCPNFTAGGDFFSTAAAVPFSKRMVRMEARGKAAKKESRAAYNRHVFGGCAKSLACRGICPAGIDVDGVLIRNRKR